MKEDLENIPPAAKELKLQLDQWDWFALFNSEDGVPTSQVARQIATRIAVELDGKSMPMLHAQGDGDGGVLVFDNMEPVRRLMIEIPHDGDRICLKIISVGVWDKIYRTNWLSR